MELKYLITDLLFAIKFIILAYVLETVHQSKI